MVGHLLSACLVALQLDMSTEFGAFLDPVADKLMVTTALILLATAPPGPLPSAAMAVPVLFIIGREIAMSSLREWAAKAGGNASKVHYVHPSPPPPPPLPLPLAGPCAGVCVEFTCQGPD